MNELRSSGRIKDDFWLGKISSLSLFLLSMRNFHCFETDRNRISDMVGVLFMISVWIPRYSFVTVLQVDKWNEQRENGVFPGPTLISLKESRCGDGIIYRFL
ncbi:hypothetical protein Tco_1192924 [Tanacetum coccineum]